MIGRVVAVASVAIEFVRWVWWMAWHAGQANERALDDALAACRAPYPTAKAWEVGTGCDDDESAIVKAATPPEVQPLATANDTWWAAQIALIEAGMNRES